MRSGRRRAAMTPPPPRTATVVPACRSAGLVCSHVLDAAAWSLRSSGAAARASSPPLRTVNSHGRTYRHDTGAVRGRLLGARQRRHGRVFGLHVAPRGGGRWAWAERGGARGAGDNDTDSSHAQPARARRPHAPAPARAPLPHAPAPARAQHAAWLLARPPRSEPARVRAFASSVRRVSRWRRRRTNSCHSPPRRQGAAPSSSRQPRPRPSRHGASEAVRRARWGRRYAAARLTHRCGQSLVPGPVAGLPVT